MPSTSFVVLLCVSVALAVLNTSPLTTNPLPVVYRDFSKAHSDFQGISSITGLGILENVLGGDGTPVRSSVPWTSVEHFSDWYHSVPGTNYEFSGYTLPWTSTPTSYYYYSSNFHPINGLGFGNEGYGTNNLFTMEAHSTFFYSGPLDWMHISADDDMWVYADGILVGEAHYSFQNPIDFTRASLIPGQSYPIAFFFAERQYTGSAISIETSIGLNELPPPVIDSCPFPLPSVLNALPWPTTCTANAIGDTCTVECLMGGGRFRSTICQANGTWVQPEDCPACPPAQVDCPFPILGTSPCTNAPSHVGLAFTCAPDTNGVYGNGQVCAATCLAPTQPWVLAEAPSAVCTNGRWEIHAVCVGAWPYTQDKACSLIPEQAGQSVATPDYWVDPVTLIQHKPEIVETGVFPGFAISPRDHLYLDFAFSTSYRVLNITGGALGTKSILVDVSSSFSPFDTLPLWYKFSYPTLPGCKGRLEMRIPIGYLQDWGFTLQKDVSGPENGKWTLTGEFFVTEARMTLTSGAWEEQQVVADFPIKITLADTLNVDLDCDLKVYGTPNASASIIMFVESKYPDQNLIVWYLVAHQFPYWLVFDNQAVLLSGITATDTVSIINGPTATPYKGVNFCDADDTSSDEPMFCYQLVKVTYHNQGVCTNIHPVTYTGTAWLYWNVACRKIPHVDPITHAVTWEAISWCNLPAQYVQASANFPLVSNDICRVNLNWDPTLDVTTHMVQTPIMNPNNGIADLQGQCCGFVADNHAYFMIYLTDMKVNHNIIFDKMTLINLTLTVASDPAVTLYTSAAGWNAATNLAATIIDPVIRCNNDNSAACKIDQPFYSMDAYPFLGFTLHLDPVYLGLLGALVPKKIKLLAWMSLDYALPVNTKVQTKLFSTQSVMMPGTSLYINQVANVFQFPTATASASSAGVIAGVVAGCVCIAAVAVGAVFLYRKKKSTSAHAKLSETSA